MSPPNWATPAWDTALGRLGWANQGVMREPLLWTNTRETAATGVFPVVAPPTM